MAQPGTHTPMTGVADADVMARAVAEGLRALGAELRSRLAPEALVVVEALLAALPDWRLPGKFVNLGKRFGETAARAAQRWPANVMADVNRLLVVELALSLGTTMAERRISADVLALVPAAAARLLGHLRDAAGSSYVYPDDHFVKDLRFAAGLTLPGGAEVFDLRSRMGVPVSLGLLRREPTAANFRAMLGSGSIEPWFRIHTESRYLRHFHEAGWDAFYLCLASMLSAHPEVRGAIGTSWFFDPELDAISPRLSYLRNPLARGAFLVRGKTGEFDIRSATGNSDIRKRLHAEGRYMPVPYTLVWPRVALLRWASTRKPTAAGPA